MIQHTQSVKCHVNHAFSIIDVHIGGPVRSPETLYNMVIQYNYIEMLKQILNDCFECMLVEGYLAT